MTSASPLLEDPDEIDQLLAQVLAGSTYPPPPDDREAIAVRRDGARAGRAPDPLYQFIAVCGVARRRLGEVKRSGTQPNLRRWPNQRSLAEPSRIRREQPKSPRGATTW